MKTLFAFLFVFIAFISMNSSALAQAAQGNVVVMTNFERAFPDEGSANELDSLATLYIDKCYGSDNQYVVSSRAVRHWWGHNNRDFIQIMEVKTWEDVIKAEQRANELFEKAWSTKEARENFNKAYSKYFTGKHSDEIYREVVFGK
jgi:hypothetical protein